MSKQVVKINESDLRDIVNNAINMVLNESVSDSLSKCYWKCDFEGKDGTITSEMIWAKTTPGAFKHAYEKSIRLGMEPKYETLRNATKKEVIEFKKMIKNRANKNSVMEEEDLIDSNSIENQIIDSDDEYATNYIVGRLFDAKEIMTDLIDYLTNSPYALEKGGETFKKHLSKATNICNELENFWGDEETKQDIY